MPTITISISDDLSDQLEPYQDNNARRTMLTKSAARDNPQWRFDLAT